MINTVKRLFRLPTPREYAERKLEEHQRELIEASTDLPISRDQRHLSRTGHC